MHYPRTKQPRHVLRSSVLLSASTLLISGCGDTYHTDIAECGDHGELHGDHCHCDEGYTLSDDGSSCEQVQEVDATGDNSDGNQATDLSLNPASSQGAVGDAQDGSKVWLLEAIDGDTILKVELYAGYGAPTSPGVVSITVNETDYATCGTCIMLRTGCVAHNDHYDCTGTFVPKAEGEVHIGAIGSVAGENLSGELKDLVFQQVSIGQNYSATPITDGDQLHLEAWSFDVQLESLDSP